MGRLVSIDGVITSPENASVSVYDRGFLYGDAVFEVLRTYGGVPFALDQHIDRLCRSADRVRMKLPVDAATMAGETRDALTAAGVGEWYARIMITRGTGPLGLDIDLASCPLRVTLVEPVKPPPREAYANGIHVVSVATDRATDGTAAAGAKVTSYLANMLALHDAKRRGGAEALIVDGQGHVLEGASSNVFIVRGDRLVTPPESAGILAGITRAHILAAAASMGLVTELTALRLDELAVADEVFITSSIREVVPCVQVDGRRIASGTPGPRTRALHAAFRKAAGAVGNMPWEP